VPELSPEARATLEDGLGRLEKGWVQVVKDEEGHVVAYRGPGEGLRQMDCCHTALDSNNRVYGECLAALGFEDTTAMCAWNDLPETRHEDVLARYRTALA